MVVVNDASVLRTGDIWYGEGGLDGAFTGYGCDNQIIFIIIKYWFYRVPILSEFVVCPEKSGREHIPYLILWWTLSSSAVPVSALY